MYTDRRELEASSFGLERAGESIGREGLSDLVGEDEIQGVLPELASLEAQLNLPDPVPPHHLDGSTIQCDSPAGRSRLRELGKLGLPSNHHERSGHLEVRRVEIHNGPTEPEYLAATHSCCCRDVDHRPERLLELGKCISGLGGSPGRDLRPDYLREFHTISWIDLEEIVFDGISKGTS